MCGGKHSGNMLAAATIPAVICRDTNKENHTYWTWRVIDDHMRLAAKCMQNLVANACLTRSHSGAVTSAHFLQIQ